MESDPNVAKLLQKAKGVFLVPQYGRGGLGVAARGGEGVLLVNNGGKWSNPVFYNFGGLSVGAQAGVEIGSMAMLLMSQKAVDNFTQQNNFSLTADAGLTIVNYTAKAQAATGREDVVVWADTKGAFADVAIGMTDIYFDEDENAAFYKAKIAAKEIVAGRVKSAAASELTQELSSGR
ncbi:MAG TPA: lipid-binding SYLF domain-containing protein [Noviherbaspirillum sp.]